MDVLFDTGSSLTYILTKDMTDEEAPANVERFDPKKSKTFKKTGEDKTQAYG